MWLIVTKSFHDMGPMLAWSTSTGPIEPADQFLKKHNLLHELYPKLIWIKYHLLKKMFHTCCGQYGNFTCFWNFLQPIFCFLFIYLFAPDNESHSRDEPTLPGREGVWRLISQQPENLHAWGRLTNLAVFQGRLKH